MKDLLAEQLLAKVMSWSPDEISNERPLLQALADYKYNEYHQYSPGMRFVESLALWLSQFETSDEKKIAYEFIKSQLIFISSDQLSHLINIAFSDKINPVLIKKSAEKLNIKEYLVKKIVNEETYKKNLRLTLFIGLSDGSRIDQLRRMSGLDNEQVYGAYNIPKSKKVELLRELKKDTNEDKFNSVFLIDDFTASGKSYFRIEESKGKILKFLQSTFDTNGSESLFDLNGMDIHILFLIATKHALDTICEGITKFKTERNLNFNHTVDAVQILDDFIKTEILSNIDFIKLIQKYFDDSIVDAHYKKGKHDEPYLGFDECGLPLILYHNTPNNSFPILWFPDDKFYRGLFPRISRHKE